MEERNYVIGDRTFTREELIEFGKQHYPKFYWIFRGSGIGLMFIGTFTAIIYLAIGLSYRSDFPEDSFNSVFYVFTIFCFILALAGCGLFIYSFVRKVPEESYLKHAVAYYTKLDTNKRAREQKLKAAANRREAINNNEKKDVSDLLKYKELLDAGIITQEEFEEKKKEYLNK